jgi:peptidoglycan biosynthesis protein MviN/MurJ (putative lipid II flippase)
VPAAAGYALLAEPIATVVGFGQMATPGARSLVAAVLLGLSFGVVGAAALNFGTQAAYAQRDARRPLVATALRAALTVCGLGVALVVLDGEPLLLAIGAIVSVSDVATGAWLCRRVRRRLPVDGSGPGSGLLRTVAATSVMALVVWPVSHLLGPPDNRTDGLLIVVVAGVAGVAAYVAAQRRLRSPELDGLVAVLSSRSRA